MRDALGSPALPARAAVGVRFFFGLLVPFCSVAVALFCVVQGPAIPIHHLTAMMIAARMN